MSHKAPRNPSPSQYQFSLNPSVNIPRCSIRRPFSHKTTIDAGKLYPLYCEEVLPGDTFNVNASIVARLTTPIVPFMDNLYLDCHFFFVPYRLVWDNWTKFCGEQDNPSDSIDYTVPCLNAVNSDGFTVGTIYDYFGLPTGVGPTANTDISALPFRAYNLVYQEWYKDEDLQNSPTISTGDGPDPLAYYSLLRRNKRKDMYTSARPWPQKGDNIVMPLGERAPVVGDGTALGLMGKNSGNNLIDIGLVRTTSQPYYQAVSGAVGKAIGDAVSSSASTGNGTGIANNGTVVGVTTDKTKSGIYADLSGATSASINDLRTAFQLQKFLEASARGGTRYTELLYTMFGVVNPDARLQRPELLGTFSIPVVVNSVPQSSATQSGSSPQGNLAAFATAVGRKHCFDKSFTEFGVVLGLVSIRSDLTYQQGLARMWSRRTRWDFYWPMFAHLGEQAILNQEIYYQGREVVDTDNVRIDKKPFGYCERWAEYKFSPSKITGQMRSTYSQPLDYWHLAQKFDALPTLNSAFIQENPPVSRVLAVTDAPAFVVDSFFDQNCVRPMPLFSIPGLIDHF